MKTHAIVAAGPRVAPFAAGALFLLSTLQFGCAGVAQKPFTDFSKSAQALQTSSDQLVGDLQATATDEFVQNVLNNPALIPTLKLRKPDMGVPPEKPPEPAPPAHPPAQPELSYDQKLDLFYQKQFVLGGLENAPYVAKLPAFRSGLYNWNAGLIAYAAALESLADPALIDNDKLNKMAADLNANLQAGRDTLNLKSVSNNDLAIFSTVATELFRAYLRAEQRSDLIHRLQDADAQIPLLARGGKEAAQIIALTVWEQYDYNFAPLERCALNSPAPNEPQHPTLDDRKKAILAILDLNIRHAATIQSLQALYNAYAALPKAHADLLAAAKKNGVTLEGIAFFLQEIQRIDTLYESLKKTAAPTTGK